MNVGAWWWVWGAAWADPAGSTAEPSAVGAVVAPSLLAQVALDYPDAALATGEHGDVSVVVEVDAAGAVVSARFESGPDVFRDAAVDAARRLAFAPATRDGSPIAATTRVWFHFAPPDVEGDEPTVEVVVHAADWDVEDTHARTTLDEAALERVAGGDLAETVAQVPGVRMAGGTADAAKPMIRGQPERRLLVLFDGARHESQKWGPDHGTEIDPFAAGTISVVRGAAGARYGPDAIGGVILVEPPPLRSEVGVGGKAVAAFASNGLRPYGAVRLDVVPAALPGLALRVEGNVAVGADHVAPDYVLGNTASRTWNLGGTAGYTWDDGAIRASWHHYDLQAGVFYGVRNTTPDEFRAQLRADRPVSADLWTVRSSIDRPRQGVAHDIGVVHADLLGALGTLELMYAFQLDHRQEFEQVRDAVDGPQFDFTLRTHSVDLAYAHPEVGLPFGRFNGGVGLQGSFQENVYRGLTLLPSYRSLQGGVFAYERLSAARFDFDLGARADGLDRAMYLEEPLFEAHVRRGTLDPADCTSGAQTERCPASYAAGSVSAGALAHVAPDLFDVKLDLSRASRFPNVDELYLLGSSPSFPVYASGDPSLGVETAWGASLTAALRHDAVEIEVSGFAQRVDDYIAFAPERGPDGEPRFDVTVRGTWPSYGYRSTDADFFGGDGTMSLGPTAPVGLDVRAALVRGRDHATGRDLVGVPADHVVLTLVGRPPDLRATRDVELRVGAELVAQSVVDPADDFAPPPPGYALVDASLEGQLGREHPVRVGVAVHNVLDVAFREYTSLLRYYADQPGRDVQVRVGVDL